MITKEFGALSPDNHRLLLTFDLKMWEEDILKDILRIIHEAAYHSKTEFGMEIPEVCVENFYEYLVRLFAAQSLIAPSSNTKVAVKIHKNDLTKLSFEPAYFEKRVVESVTDESVLTQQEREKIKQIRLLHLFETPVSLN